MTRRRSLKAWIRENRKAIDAAITWASPSITGQFNDEERRQWVLNDEGLYRWARSEGVNV